MMNTLLIIICIISLVVRCTPDSGQSAFQRDIPVYDGIPDALFGVIQNNAQQIGLPNILDGVDSISIRIWYRFPFVEKHSVLVLEHNELSWTGNLYRFKYDMDTTRMEKLTEIDVVKVEPAGGWHDYISELLAHRALTLPDMRSIPKLEDGMLDGSNYSVEVATRMSYRFYNYHGPENFTEFSAAQDMVDILNLNARELGIKWQAEDRVNP